MKRVLLVALLVNAACCGPVVTRGPFEQTYLAAEHNWALRDHFPQADGLLNAFDYGHAALYAALVARPTDTTRIEHREFDFITMQLLRHPPRVPLDEAAIGPNFAKLAPEVMAMFDWAHMLHRQLYDIWSAWGLSDAQRDAAVARVFSYYAARSDLALSRKPKSMSLMEGQPYSLSFRRQDPKFNGLLWSYHWFQLALYDGLIEGRTESQLQSRVDSTITAFFRLIAEPPSRMPAVMPMAPMASPVFADRYPEAAIVFDNLHALHDVVSDILASPTIAKRDKRAALLRAAAAYRDSTTSVISVNEWRLMAGMHHP